MMPGNDYDKPKGAVEVVHRCPPKGSAFMPCCGRTPFEVPRWHRMTIRNKVTCDGK